VLLIGLIVVGSETRSQPGKTFAAHGVFHYLALILWGSVPTSPAAASATLPVVERWG
jgi:hypothetical protein